MTRKGQVTVPIEFRRELGIDEGDSVAFERAGDALIVRPVGSVVERTRGALAKYAKHPPLTAEEERAAFEQAVADEQVETDERIRGYR
ncbi:MAG: AbrB/MazE/SpoVT family DNA-binding domain-containing protein [Thermomicrobiales bacterium]|jgi:AbrB family looped-hinge helix DNA binding protein|nr:AbrB/MazE/SpoVT family DNA-binding domain-containing protein [Thermomicrobiales bacterium]MCC6943990.1 AbrB/MazE/SpoVT family DNA-binding domain-containing protein [Thermomicrobiales bacterium]